MTAQIIDGKAVAAKVQEQVRLAIEARTARGLRAPALATVLVGADPASQVYVRNKRETCKRVGVRSVPVELPADIPQAALLAEVARLNAEPDIDGILVQLPLPAPLDGEAVVATIDPAKDVDGLTPVSAGLLTLGKPGLVPCTPAGSMRLIDEAGCDPSGKRAVVVGRSVLVGKPIAQLLLARNATVTIAHSRTSDLGKVVGEADIVIAAVGKQGLVRGEWIKPGAVVIDVGINRGADGKLRGDVDFESARLRAGWITPVPGGVGPMTVAMLMSNTLIAAERRRHQSA